MGKSDIKIQVSGFFFFLNRQSRAVFHPSPGMSSPGAEAPLGHSPQALPLPTAFSAEESNLSSFYHKRGTEGRLHDFPEAGLAWD